MANTYPDRNARSYRVYITTSLEPQIVIDKLRGEDSIGEEDDYKIVLAKDVTTQEVCQRHRAYAVDGGELYTELFIVADSEQLDTRGVLVVNLKPYHGYPDAVRLEPEDAGNTIASLSIGNTTWFELRESSGDRTPLVPGNYFSLYNLMGEKSGEFDLAVKTMNDGVHDIVPDDEEHNIHYDVPGPPYGVARQYHRGSQTIQKDIGRIAQAHPACAKQEGRDPIFFAVADRQFDGAGPLIVRVEPMDSFRCKNPAAGEILGWIYMNFMQWEDAKTFASEEDRG